MLFILEISMIVIFLPILICHKALRSELQDLTPDLAIAATCPLVFTIVESYRFDIHVMTKNHRVFSHFLIFAVRKIC